MRQRHNIHHAMTSVIGRLFSANITLRKVAGKWSGLMPPSIDRYRPTPSKYMPHQGKAECTRRRAQA